MLLGGDKGITRRRFTLGSVAAAAATAVVSLLPGCGIKNSSDEDGEPQVVKDESKIVSVTEDYKVVDIDLAASQTWTLPLGTLLNHSEGSWAAAMFTPESALHANTIGVVSLTSGATTTLMQDPSLGDNYHFYDVRCSDSVFAWVEMNYVKSKWTLFAQDFKAGQLTGNAVKLDSGGVDYDPPLFTTSDSTVYWYHMPSSSGSKTTEASLCFAATTAGSKPEEVYRSTGRFACRPRVSDGVLTITPRVRNSEGVYYGITALDLANNRNRLAQLVLPASVKPFEVEYMDGKFVFSIEASYSGVGSLGNMGTYIGVEGGPYIYVSREPLAQVAGKGSRYLIKTQASHFLVDTDAKTFGSLLSPDRSLDYGDYPASEGTSDNFLTFATVRDEVGIPSNVTARLFSLA